MRREVKTVPLGHSGRHVAIAHEVLLKRMLTWLAAREGKDWLAIDSFDS